ncbi:ATP-binding cassette domain-containing protein [Flavobacterium sp. NRK F10]|uniref:ABC transporter ATP-binding protein n=1 Tax=Flavobacterium sediminis TaxID=2201181 RepID=A0A2U8QSK5_9FLAO|nr:MULTISPECIES: ATP-binding cassette domain-containing protein [Flavobacterium]AWM13143.1 ABC transporter ATP-binding protein [Flavobacterium sediminis]MCO6174302.1 ATP-binding cassette domain-containing protein [Flavobacterium sp. NRK F10]
MISTKGITFSYADDQLFHMPDLHCDAGNTILITGDSGKGKTTYLHILAGLLKPKTGEILVDKTDIVSLSEAKGDKFRGKHIGLVLQKSIFIAAFTVLENLEMASWLATGKKNTERAKRLLEQLDITDQSHKLPNQLSIGQQQRVSIARALMNEPKVLLADEPTSSLDDKNAEKVIKLLTDLSKEYKAALVIVTHDTRIKEKFINKITMV